ncbi:hypothetical protein BG418_18390 [Streptomyces sp. CBMA152]|nr:hypothetical protein [Streptomyces sp. CBMA152]
MIVVHRTKHAKNFVQMANQTVLDERLSRLARQILTELVARPPGWQTTADAMADEGKRQRGPRAESRRAIRAAFAELEEFGYMIRTRSRIPKGQPNGGGFMTTLDVYDVPQTGQNEGGRYEGVGRWTPS